MRKRLSLTLALVTSVACHNRHVNGTRLQPVQQCDKNWVAVLDNSGTDRYYDLYVGNRLVGSAEPRRVSRITIDPSFGQVTPHYVLATTSRDIKGPYLGNAALRMSCE